MLTAENTLANVRPDCKPIRFVAHRKQGGPNRFNPIKNCVICLYKVGYGSRVIEHQTQTGRSLALKWIRKAGIKGKDRPRISCKVKRRDNYGKWKTNGLPIKELRCAFVEESRAVMETENLWSKHKSLKAYYYTKRYKNDMAFMVQERIKRRMSKLVRMETPRSSATVRRYAGMDSQNLKRHIESQFERGMSWNNYGKWEIDHVIPCSAFDLSKESDVLKCFHYSNIRPLWRKDNNTKRDKVLPTQLGLLLDHNN